MQICIQAIAMQCIGNDRAKTLFKNDFLEVKWEADCDLLTAHWWGWLDTNKGHEGCEVVLDLVRQRGVQKMLNNNARVTGASGDTSWLGKVWLPSLRDAGLRYFAWVYSPELFTQLQVDSAIALFDEIEIKTFIAEEDARIWLEQF